MNAVTRFAICLIPTFIASAALAAPDRQISCLGADGVSVTFTNEDHIVGEVSIRAVGENGQPTSASTKVIFSSIDQTTGFRNFLLQNGMTLIVSESAFQGMSGQAALIKISGMGESSSTDLICN